MKKLDVFHHVAHVLEHFADWQAARPQRQESLKRSADRLLFCFDSITRWMLKDRVVGLLLSSQQEARGDQKLCKLVLARLMEHQRTQRKNRRMQLPITQEIDCIVERTTGD